MLLRDPPCVHCSVILFAVHGPAVGEICLTVTAARIESAQLPVRGYGMRRATWRERIMAVEHVWRRAARGRTDRRRLLRGAAMGGAGLAAAWTLAACGGGSNNTGTSAGGASAPSTGGSTAT